ncbi:MAG: hypothetical protein PHI06_11265 [Desulfobulbaceae bacterium]|nr:hypothetical protein [Desulfobulbaceae bacterium]
MIQDFASVFVVGKQSVRFRPVPIRENVIGQKIIGGVLAGALLLGIAVSFTLYLLIQSGLNDLATQSVAKAAMVKAQNGLYAKREALLDRKTFARSAEKLGLYLPENNQIRRL